MKMHCKRITVSLISLMGVIGLTGCSSMMSGQMPNGSITMQQAYDDAVNDTSGAGGNILKQVRASMSALRAHTPNYGTYTRVEENEMNAQFPQLPNPNIVMYVYPHEAGSDDNLTPIPGYSTVFPMYTHVYYAMSGEVVRQ